MDTISLSSRPMNFGIQIPMSLKITALSVGWHHKFTETFLLDMSMGGRYSEQEYYYTEDSYRIKESDNTTGYIADFRLTKESEVVVLSAGIQSESLYEGGGGAKPKWTPFIWIFERRLLRRLKIGLAGSLYS